MSSLGKKILIICIFAAFAPVPQISTCLGNFLSTVFSINEQVSFDASDVDEPLFLTPYIEEGKLIEARKLATVTVPGVDWVRKSYAGFITIQKYYRSNLYFWYFEAEHNPENAPILLWIQGGPGSTSLLGLFGETGPFNVDKFANPIKRNYSWHINHHLIFVDNPVSTGYSFTKLILGHPKNTLECADGLYKFFVQFFKLFPKLAGRDLYLTGESYAGKYIPALAYTIHKKKMEEDPNSYLFNLVGILIGSGFINPMHQLQPADHLYQLGFIDDKIRDYFYEHQTKAAEELEKGNIIKGALSLDKIYAGVLSGGPDLGTRLGLPYLENYSLLNPPAYYIEAVVNNEIWRRAMHVGNLKFHFNSNFLENAPARYMIFDFLESNAWMLPVLLDNYRVFLFNGQFDLVCPYPGLVNMLRHLNFSGKEDYLNAERHIWRVGNEVAGYVKESGNLTEALVRNAGHMIPSDQPKWAYDAISRFTAGKSFKQ